MKVIFVSDCIWYSLFFLFADMVPDVKPVSGKGKPTGTDNGFKSGEAQCDTSVIRLAHQIVSNKLLRKLKAVEEEFATQPPGFNRSIRRGSKSLPSTPSTSPRSSPKSRRRQSNRYFVDDIDGSKIEGSQILSGFIRKQDNLSQPPIIINKDDGLHNTITKSLAQVSIDAVAEATRTRKKSVKELREMNFWSPTSM